MSVKKPNHWKKYAYKIFFEEDWRRNIYIKIKKDGIPDKTLPHYLFILVLESFFQIYLRKNNILMMSIMQSVFELLLPNLFEMFVHKHQSSIIYLPCRFVIRILNFLFCD